MELRHLRYFVAVAGTLNFSKAAALLRLAQPALSRQIRDLEAELGVTLLERHARGARLTPAGSVFLPEAQAVLDRAQQAFDVVRRAADSGPASVELGYAPSPTAGLLPRALQTLQRLVPNVRVLLHDLSSEEMLRGVREERLDLALLVRPCDRALRGLQFAELARFPIQVAVGPGHPLAAGGTAVAVAALAGERFHLFAPAEYPEYRRWLEPFLAPTAGALRVAGEHDGALSLIAAVEAGPGVALVPSCLGDLAGNRLRFRALRPAPDPVVVGMCWRSTNANLPAARLRRVLLQLREGETAGPGDGSPGLPREAEQQTSPTPVS